MEKGNNWSTGDEDTLVISLIFIFQFILFCFPFHIIVCIQLKHLVHIQTLHYFWNMYSNWEI